MCHRAASERPETALLERHKGISIDRDRCTRRSCQHSCSNRFLRRRFAPDGTIADSPRTASITSMRSRRTCDTSDLLLLQGRRHGRCRRTVPRFGAGARRSRRSSRVLIEEPERVASEARGRAWGSPLASRCQRTCLRSEHYSQTRDGRCVFRAFRFAPLGLSGVGPCSRPSSHTRPSHGLSYGQPDPIVVAIGSDRLRDVVMSSEPDHRGGALSP